MYAGLNAKLFDVIANQTNPSPERLKKYDYSAPYNYSAGVIVTKADNDSIKSIPWFKKVKNLHNLQPVTGAKTHVIMVQLLWPLIAWRKTLKR